MMCLQYLVILLNLTAQPTVGIPAFTAEKTDQYQLPFLSGEAQSAKTETACDTLSVTAKTGQNGPSRTAFNPSQAHQATSAEMAETALEILHPGPKTRTHERLGTLKNALRGPPPLAWGGTRIESSVYGQYELGSTVAPKSGVAKTGVNSRLTTRMQKWNDYQARGGTKTLKEWTTHTRAQPWGHGAKTKMKFPSDHGNTAGSQTAWLYRLETDGGSFLKWGISQNPETRYSGTFMKGKRILPLQSGQRRMILRMERELVETTPGPLNFEPWAGASTQ